MVHLARKYTITLALYFGCIASCYSVFAQDIPEILDLTVVKGDLGSPTTVSCSVSPFAVEAEWLYNNQLLKIVDRIKQVIEERTLQKKDLDGNPQKYKVYNLTIANTTADDDGNYTCVSRLGEAKVEKAVVLDLSFPAKLISKTPGPIRHNVTDQANVTLQCVFEVYKTNEVTWWKKGTEDDTIDYLTKPAKRINIKQIESSYDLHIHSTEHNGTYICQVWDPVSSGNMSAEIDVMVYAVPQVFIDKVIPISASQLFLNWTIRSYNSPIKSYNLMYRQLPSNDFSLYIKEKIGVKNISFVMEGLHNSTKYQLRLEVSTTHGQSKHTYENTVTTLDKDPIFVPNISIKGFSATSVTIGWAPPPDDIAELIHYYLLEARKMNEVETRSAYHPRDSRNPYMFDNLEPHSTYVFRVCACSDFTKKCGPWSAEMHAATLDGIPGRPSNVTVHCSSNWLNLTWSPPLKPNAEIKVYSIELTGNATYRNEFGVIKQDTWGPFAKFTTNSSRSVRQDDLQPNTNYTIRVIAMTRTRRRGEEETRYCSTAPAPPPAPPRPRWRKVPENDKYVFTMKLPRVSERNGPICCYRVYMVRLLPNSDWNNLPPPKDIAIVDYEEAHSVQPVLGAYITDVFSNDKFPSESELIMGDGKSIYDKDDPTINRESCRRCLRKPRRHYELAPPRPPVTTTTVATTTKEDDLFDDDVIDTTEDPVEEEKRGRRSYDLDIERDYMKNPMMMDKLVEEVREELQIRDGLVDPNANYTCFVELIPGSELDAPLYSEYLHVLSPAAAPLATASTSPLELALMAICGVASLVVVVMIGLCVVQARRSRKLPPHAHLEMNPIQAALRYVVGHIGGRQTVSGGVPPELPPIPRDRLAAAYAERQLDSDYGFQKEFELLQMLPECFPDRTTHASEARENQPKNRYPDIKAYDQTRVKLLPVDGVPGSDYINANYVMGYKERKQFICAQGPTDTTVNDFWRMIWEHGLELIVMLTNLEEYSKVKCSKYWPDEVRGVKAFGGITVHHVSEKRYSDYIVRELKISKHAVDTDGQPIVENNGIAKRNGDCAGLGDSSAPTSPREGKGEARLVRQYHFLMWKDFAAPEHPHSILKFIKRVNEAWLGVVGRPAVVHCSAGVGRTGTLVALDCLLEQLRTTGAVAVFNTVAELRRQRNFLVQSLKQYVFVYRALVEYAHYGDTEIPASRLKSSIDRLRNTPEGADKCLMEHEFEKMMSPPVAEVGKSCVAGGAGVGVGAGADELRARNRSADCLPYDRNRVILAPLPARDYSTYINASFIEAYDNSEGFIITQDPLPNTIMDFWRMVSEHNVSTIVMLSELGEGKCPRYWDDGTAQYEHISVQYEESESCPYYTRRQFRVTNNKNGSWRCVRQLQYQGWPTAAGHVPEVTRGLAELAELAAPLDAPLGAPRDPRDPLLVHCHYGTERSALFVALCILIWQLRVERRVDVNSVARKVRSQRAKTIDTFLQYEFLHRAILNYAELHNLLDDS